MMEESALMQHIQQTISAFASKMLQKNKSKLSQIWVETAVYTLIGLTIIGILLSIANPQIEKIKDRSIIKQTIDSVNTLDDKISEVEQSPANVGIIDLRVAKGRLVINSTNDSVVYIMEDTRLELSQIDQEIREGNIFIKTIKHGNRFSIFLTRHYYGLNITYSGADMDKILQAAASPYKIRIENQGQEDIDQKTKLDFNIL